MKKKLRYGLKKTVSWMLSLVLVSGFFTLAWPLNAVAATPSWTGTGSSAPYYVSSMVEVGGTIYAGATDGSGMWTCSDGVWTPLSGSPSFISSMVKGTDDKIYVSYSWEGDLNDVTTVSSYDYTSGTWTKMGKPSYYVFCLLVIKGQNTDPDVIYAATADGLYLYTAGTSTWTPITTMCTRSITEVGGTIYARMNDSVYTYSLVNNIWTLTKICDYGNSDEIPQTFAYIDDTLYFRDDLGVYSYTTDSNGTTSCAIMTGSPDNVFACAEINGTLYAGADDGLYAYSGGSSGTWSKIPGSPNFVQSMLYSNGTLYAGTVLNGATWRCSNGVWTLAAPGKMNAIQAIGNAVYAGTDDAVWRYSSGSWTQMNGSPAKVTCMQNVDGTLYAGAVDGVWSYSGGTWTKMSGSPVKVTCMLSNAIGLLNVGTGDGQLWSYNDSSGSWTMLADKVEIIPDNNNDPIYDISAGKVTSLVYKNSFINVGGYSNTGTGGDVWRYYNYKFHRYNNSEPVNVDSVVDFDVNSTYDIGVVSQNLFYRANSNSVFIPQNAWPTVSKATNMGGTVYAWGNKVWRYNSGSWTELSGAPKGVNCMAYINGTPYAGANGLYLYTTPSAPTISSQPANRAVTAGDTAAFTVAATSNDGWVLSYQWQKSTDGGGAWSNIAGANTDSFTTATLSTSDSGAKYRCVVTDAIGGSVASNPAALTVAGIPPTISPASRHYDLNAPADVTTAITWNSTASVSNMVYTVSPDTTHYALASGDYAVSGGNLTVKNSFFSGLSLTSGTAIAFDINFNTGDSATLAVDVVNGYTPGSNADLNGLSVNGTPVSGFDPNDIDYAVELPNGTASATVTATVSDSHAQVSITQVSSLPGTATVTVTAEDGTTTKAYSISLTVASGGGGGGGGGGSTPIETTEITTTVSGNTATVNIPKAALEQATDGKDGLKLSTPVASLSFDTAALSTIFGEASGDVKITATKVDASSLTDEAKELVGDRPVFNFSVTSGNDTISDFGGNVTVSVPYTLKEGEDPDAIVIYYINSKGEPAAVANCKYDPVTKTVSFTTDHFSQYAVGYNKVSFSDVKAGAWYENAVEFAAARDIVTGTGNGNYSPDGKLTRGQLLVMLMRAYDVEPDTDLSNNFSDAGNTYYTGYLAAAKRLGITGGLGNNLYAPDKQITRQEMFTLLYNTLKVIGQLPEDTENAGGALADSGALTDYSDADSVASWAKDAAGTLADAGIIGGSNGKLSPKNTTTRAEMAQVLYNLLSK